MTQIKHLTKRALCLLLVLILTAALCACSKENRDPVSIESQGSDAQKFTNRVDGYELTLPADAEIDTDMLAVRTAIYMGGVSLYVYYQPCDGDFNADTYIGYSNTTITNPDRHSPELKVEDSGTMTINGCTAEYAVWSRRALAHVENDRNRYACYDIRVKGGDVCTLYFKYADEADLASVIEPVRDSFRQIRRTAEAPKIVLGSDASVPASGEAKVGYETLFAPDAGLTWGVFEPSIGIKELSEVNKMPELQEKLSFHFPIALQYTDFTMHPGVLEKMLSRLEPDQIPELTIQTSPREDSLMLLDVLDGKYDEYLQHYAAVVAARETPVLFRPCNEMNGDWCSYCAFQFGRDTDLYLEFYRYLYQVFQDAGADNCIWVWNPNHRSFPNFKWNDERMYYPGDEYVNVLGITAYNTGTYYDAETWQSFDELYEGLYADVLAGYRQPMMITEFACSGIGGDKAAWIADMFDALPKYPQIKAAVWWNGADYDGETVARPYWLDETEETTAAMRDGLSRYAG